MFCLKLAVASNEGSFGRSVVSENKPTGFRKSAHISKEHNVPRALRLTYLSSERLTCTYCRVANFRGISFKNFQDLWLAGTDAASDLVDVPITVEH